MSEIQGEPFYVSIEIENRECQGLHVLQDLGIPHHSLIDIRSLSEGLTRHLIRVPSELKNKLDDRLSPAPQRSNVSGQASAWFDTAGCLVCQTILANSSFLISGECIQDFTVIYNFVTPNFQAFQNVVSKLETSGFKLRILEVSRYESRGDILTEKQERALWFAITLGFFEWPRRITLTELAEKLGISASTLSELMRRGLRRVMRNYFSK
jgi:predicted DNA binding protein